MNQDELHRQIRAMLAGFGLLSDDVAISHVKDTDLDALAQRLGLDVPESLRDWLKFVNGSLVGTIFFLGVRPDCNFLDIDHIVEAHRLSANPQWVERGWIPVAGDGCGNYYLVATREPGAPVFFYDSIGFVPDMSQGIFAVGSDIWHFAHGLISFELGSSVWWPFDEEKMLSTDPDMGQPMSVPKAWEA